MQTEETATAIDISKPSPKKPVVLKSKTILPAPKNNARSFTGKSVPKFFEWYGEFSPQQASVADVKIYRKYPVIDLKLASPQAKYKDRIDTIEGPMPFPVADYESHFLHHYGSGRYQVLMNEKGVPGIVASCVFEVENEAYPPRVDYQCLVRGHPENQGYIDGLRARGVKLPWESSEQEPEGNMTVATQLADTMMRTNERLTDKNEALIEKVVELRDQAQAPATTATVESIRLMADTARTSNTMFAENMRLAAAATTPAMNPMEFLKTAAELLKPAGDGGIGLATLINSINERNQQQQQASFDRIVDLLKSQREPVIASNGIDSLLDQADKLQRVKELFGWSSRGQQPNPTESTGKTLGTILGGFLENPKVAEGIGMLLSVVAGMMMKNAAAAPAMNPAPTNGTAPVTAPASTPQPAQPTQPTPEQQAAAQQTKAFQQWIEKPFLAHFFGATSRLDGYSFAAALQCELMDPDLNEIQISQEIRRREITPKGRQMYEQITKQWGRKAFEDVLLSHHEINSMCGGNKKQFSEFLNQFFTYDRWAAEQQRAQQSGSATAQ